MLSLLKKLLKSKSPYQEKINAKIRLIINASVSAAAMMKHQGTAFPISNDRTMTKTDDSIDKCPCYIINVIGLLLLVLDLYIVLD